MKMKLSNLRNKIQNIEIYRDNEFNYIDYSNSKLNNKVLTFIESESYIDNLSSSITCIICNNEILKLIPKKYGVILSENPRLDFF